MLFINDLLLLKQRRCNYPNRYVICHTHLRQTHVHTKLTFDEDLGRNDFCLPPCLYFYLLFIKSLSALYKYRCQGFDEGGFKDSSRHRSYETFVSESLLNEGV